MTRAHRALADTERAALTRVADCLIGDGVAGAAPSQAAGFERWLDRALAARRDVFTEVLALAAELATVRDDELRDTLREASAEPGGAFTDLSSILAGAYLMLPEVRERLGYPGQGEHPAPFDQSAEELMSGILDPVVARGPIYRPVETGGGA